MKRSPVAAFWLSSLPGLGHIYLGQTAKGVAFALLTVGLIDLVAREGSPFGILIPIYWLFVMLDAHRSSQTINRAIEAGAPATELLEGGGSKWWGGTLIGIGVFFLLVNFDIIDLHWLWQFWPAVLIILGIRLIRPELFPKPAPAPPPVPTVGDAGEATGQGEGTVGHNKEVASSYEGGSNERAEAS